ncbi:hypothetical protein B342_06975 [Francisella tularensis subsp. tularensis 80700103]|nr:hypothetical protein [Francisella tularensis]EKM85866.1 hypothetical protein B344_06904 [Francisella tularensis subsp. tularensis 831]EKM91988.1 hypothetical protein B342_06975 [Francisella tularensis subsp. tularensis 80700103]EKT89510.1 hypothetical protein B229_06895 [Francisella tularensis subsp. tularensis 70001275]AJI63602.1 hypothetical protein CH65_42 [Francisella tularensis subsp. tularensis]AKU72905.1 hypothetical protein ACX55_286 [Francisella tularensis subsp. tularensis]
MYLGTAVAINVATTMYDSYQQSDGSLEDFSNIYTQKVNEIEMNGVGDYIIGAFTGDTWVKAAADVGQWLGGVAYDWTPDFIKEIMFESSQSGNQETLRVIRRDLLTLDLDGDGIETVSADGSVLFDSNADGVKRGTDDGLLVRDIDGSGTIDNGQELFGDATVKSDGTVATDGFDALSDLDSNNDGVFDANDTAFEEVKVWQDKDQDGVTDDGELTSLADAGIDSIDLNAKTVNKSVAGGILRKTSTATNTDGTTTAVGAMDFAENKFYSKFEEVLQSSQDLQNSINVAGQGALRSLHESASQSPKLNELLKDLYSGNKEITDAQAHQVLLEWAKTLVNFETSLDLLDGFTLDDGTQINVGLSDRVRNVIEKTAILEALNRKAHYTSY